MSRVAGLASVSETDFLIYAEGLVSASVCSSLPQEEVEKRMAAQMCGTASGWVLSKAPTFRQGQPNPCPCERNPATHKHYLFEC